MKRGLFLTLEGVDGAGKSTHIDWICSVLRQRDITVVSTREPGGTALGEQLREILLHQPMQLETEALLMFAARCEHVRAVIEPALRRGDWVVCDRFTDATFAYQGGGRRLGATRLATLEQWVHPHLQPDRTWLFDVPLDIARQRLGRARQADRFEQESDAFFERTRVAYHQRAAGAQQRIRIIDASQPIPRVRETLQQDLQALIDAG